MPSDFPPNAAALAVSTVRALTADAVEQAQSGHPGSPMGFAEVAVELWTRHLRHDPKDPSWLGRDRVVLSAGHASMLLYCMLHFSGYGVSLDDLRAFRQWGSKTPGHPEVGLTPGVETTTGPLGQGISNAVGMALASKMKEARFGEPFRDVRVFAIVSDGDMQEGVSAEASSLAGHLGLGNLVVLYDDNQITIEGRTSLAWSEDVGKRYEAYGWSVQSIDGHNAVQAQMALENALAETARPSLILCRTVIGRGAPNLQGTADSHGAPLGKAEVAATKVAMGFDPEKSFVVPESVYELFRHRGEELAEERASWQVRFEGWQKSNVVLAEGLEALQEKRVPKDLFDRLLEGLPDKDDPTRSISGVLQQKVASLVPSLVGGSADLAPSTKTLIKGSGSISHGHFEGRNLHFGIREHAMGAICNGLALSGGFIPYGSTFLIFSDYFRPAIRLSGLMRQQCLWIFTHDSIFVGEDGPTHQPIEQVWSLRMVPNLYVVRPADALEVAAAWTMALERRHGPTALVLTRQKVPAKLPRDPRFDPRDVLRGAYTVRDAKGGTPEVVIVATGSEVGLALGAQAALQAEGCAVRVVSAPCLERFAEQPTDYANQVIPPWTRTVSIEAGRTGPWRGVLGKDTLTIGLDYFGKSAPEQVLAEKFGLTVEAVTERVRSWLKAR